MLSRQLSFVLVCAVLVSSCKGKSEKAAAAPSEPVASEPLAGKLLLSESLSPCLKGLEGIAADDPAWEFQRILAAKGDFAPLASLVAGAPADPDDFLRVLFPSAAGKLIVDRPEQKPLPSYTGQIDSGFEAHAITLPIDWDANPFSDVSWQLWFQSLNWLGKAEPDMAAYTIVDWADNALYRDPPLNFSWNDHAMGMRLRAVTGFVNAYTKNSTELDRRVLQAAATLVLVHIYGLASSPCYTQKHNHGLMQDLALLEYLDNFPGLRDGGLLRKLAMSRAGTQIAMSVKPDGIQIENAPHYQAHYANMALRVLAASQIGGHASDPEVLAHANKLLSALTNMVQPNFTLTQFGDTTNIDHSAELSELSTRGRALGLDPVVVDELDWVLSRGARGQQPKETDTVYPDGGYAAFRDAWTTTDQAITAHFRVGHWSRAHYHPDETGFEIFGFGTELIIGPGVHGYDKSDAFAGYQASPAANNVLVVDEFDAVERKPHARSKILAHGSSNGVAWVQGSHPNYEALGVQLVRTFAHHKPTQFVIVDHIVAPDEHRYAQHFHLHPSLSKVKRIGNTVIARTADGKGPSVTLTTTGEMTVDFLRGVKQDESVAGWHFPDKYKSVPATDVVLNRLQKGADSKLALPVLIVISAPGESPVMPKNLSYSEAEGHLELAWRQGKQDVEVSVPLPPRDDD